MNLLTNCLILIVAFFSGIDGILDEWQFHQPIVTCTLTGLIYGDLNTGILIGAALQVITIGWMNLASVVAPDIAFAGVTGGIMVCGPAQLTVSQGVIIAILASVVGQWLTVRSRKVAVNFVHQADQAALDGKLSLISSLHIKSMTIQGLRVLLPTVLVLLISVKPVGDVFRLIPKTINHGLDIAASILAIVGFSIIVTTVETKSLWIWFAGGFVLAAFLKLSLVAVILIGIFLTAIYLVIEAKRQNKQPDDPFGDDLDDL
ncbi:hypothetical protein PL11_007550 [Lentilactobacillus curieae]|uniref:PTS system, mannose-specific IIC component n=1 Tax=Lentilactobacillus curieae TaxID=1138822 RepID=A0A1S6QJH4_9LACO|nr:PTS sugar transporter subunit IIC [Lentilactobacillus curieae]AQW21777.1 hypothetical protein PL11_007550 [Lentilactobacillus curieae]